MEITERHDVGDDDEDDEDADELDKSDLDAKNQPSAPIRAANSEAPTTWTFSVVRSPAIPVACSICFGERGVITRSRPSAWAGLAPRLAAPRVTWLVVHLRRWRAVDFARGEPLRCSIPRVCVCIRYGVDVSRVPAAGFAQHVGRPEGRARRSVPKHDHGRHSATKAISDQPDKATVGPKNVRQLGQTSHSNPDPTSYKMDYRGTASAHHQRRFLQGSNMKVVTLKFECAAPLRDPIPLQPRAPSTTADAATENGPRDDHVLSLKFAQL
ncbi:hypothetical protein HPB51_014310 [Rhipicephalus microplus]|uniref:Uncharacterized protein n=1 Tax=Rhipicephalus microplus TaxID=6941 RepID=A0A9J6DAM2_RHIMP|nr:hypothetical protein HPB51_014310 [Rhipicephalus microplus]